MLTRKYACSEHSIRVEIYMGYDLFKESVLVPIRRRYLVQRLNVNNVEEKENCQQIEREQIVILNSMGLNSNKISESLGMHPSTVRPILKNFFQKGSVEHDPRSGKSRMAEVGGDRFDQEEKFSKL